MQDVAGILAALDEPTARAAASAVTRLLGGSVGGGVGGPHALDELDQLDLQRFLWRELPTQRLAGRSAHHDVAWALADVLELAGRGRYAALCRDRVTHEVLEAWRRGPDLGSAAAADAERRSGVLPPDTQALRFAHDDDDASPLERLVRHEASRVLEQAVERGDLRPGPASGRLAEGLVEEFLRTPSAAHHGTSPRDEVRGHRARAWAARLTDGDTTWVDGVLPQATAEPDVPSRPDLSVAPARALLEAAAGGLALTRAGQLPADVVAALDDRFAWSDDRPLTRRAPQEADLPPLLFLRQHLQAQRLLTVRGGRLALSPSGRGCLDDADRLWSAVVGPGPRWADGFDGDALAVLAGVLLRSPAVSREDLLREATFVLGAAWHRVGGEDLAAAVDWLRVDWYRVGVAFGWWERSRGRWLGLRLSRLGRAAAARTFWAAAARPRSGRPAT